MLNHSWCHEGTEGTGNLGGTAGGSAELEQGLPWWREGRIGMQLKEVCHQSGTPARNKMKWRGQNCVGLEAGKFR